MKLYDTFPFQADARPRALALGFFDGLHLGHLALMRALIEAANARHIQSAVFTFADHPDSLFQPELRFQGLIQSRRARLKRIAASGIDELISAPLIPEVYQIEAKEFFFTILIGCFQAKVLVVGEDFRFGFRGKGDVAQLRRWSRQAGIDLIVVPDVIADGAKISSTRIRELIRKGEIEAANRLLGYDYTIQGQVIHGNKLGRRLGFPTLNIRLDEEMVQPKFGVYASDACFGQQSYPAITNIGTKPTVSDDAVVQAETHLYEQTVDWYDQTVDLVLYRFIRSEERFDSVDELMRRIRADFSAVKEFHNARKKSSLPDEHKPTINSGL